MGIEWALLSTLILLGSLGNGMGSVEHPNTVVFLLLEMGWVLRSRWNTKRVNSQGQWQTDLSNGMGFDECPMVLAVGNGMGSVEYREPVGF